MVFSVVKVTVCVYILTLSWKNVTVYTCSLDQTASITVSLHDTSLVRYVGNGKTTTFFKFEETPIVKWRQPSLLSKDQLTSRSRVETQLTTLSVQSQKHYVYICRTSYILSRQLHSAFTSSLNKMWRQVRKCVLWRDTYQAFDIRRSWASTANIFVAHCAVLTINAITNVWKQLI